MCVFVGHTYIPHTEAPPYTVIAVMEGRMATIVYANRNSQHEVVMNTIIFSYYMLIGA